MFVATIPEQTHRFFNENTEEFVTKHVDETTLHLEHSLISLQEWEAKWKKPFLDEKEKTLEEILDYIRCMTLNEPRPDPEVYNYIPRDVFDKIIDYIKDQQTATWFSNNRLTGAQRSSREKITAEIIYYWMFSLGIPIEFQNRHLSQLLTLIKVMNIKNGGDKGQRKMSKAEVARERARLNAERRAKYNTKG